MKRILCLLLAVMLLGVTALAADSITCTVQAAAVTAGAGETVDVTVSVVGNPGFTNFAILLDYDREALTLLSITPAESGLLTAVNTAYKAVDGKSYGFVSAAAETEQSGDGALFTASFLVAEGFSGTAAVTPIVQYMRNNAADYSFFSELKANAAAGSIGTAAAIPGDFDGDGSLKMTDIAKIYKAFRSEEALTAAQLAAVDANGNGKLDMSDFARIYKLFKEQ